MRFPNASPMLNFGEAINRAANNLLNINGRARRSEFWWTMLVVAIFIHDSMHFIHRHIADNTAYNSQTTRYWAQRIAVGWRYYSFYYFYNTYISCRSFKLCKLILLYYLCSDGYLQYSNLLTLLHG